MSQYRVLEHLKIMEEHNEYALEAYIECFDLEYHEVTYDKFSKVYCGRFETDEEFMVDYI